MARAPTAPLLVVLAALAHAACGDFAQVGIAADAQPATDAGGGDDGAGSASSAGGSGAPTPSTRIDDCASGNPAGLDARGAEAALDSATRDPEQRLLYPYDGTVFPAGFEPPLLMWSGPSAEAVLLRVRGSGVEYVGCLPPSGEGQLAVPAMLWSRLEASSTGGAVELQLATLRAGVASGMLQAELTIARAPLKGSIFAMRYRADAVDATVNNAAVVRMQPGQTERTLFAGMGCTGCHSMSANGTRMITYAQGFGVAFTFDAVTTDNPAAQLSALPGGELPAVYPDGSLYVAPAHPLGFGPRTYFGGPQANAGLYETATAVLSASSGIPSGATTPMFSPSGRLLAFNDYALGNGHGLAVMDFDARGRGASNYRALVESPTEYPAWPSFLPDDRALVFALGVTSDFSGSGARIGGKSAPGPSSDLYIVDLAGNAHVRLSRAMGFASEGDDAGTLPFGSEELHQSYDPNVYPVSVGGYAWVFFDSIRHYGNQGLRRHVWGAALELSPDGTYAADPSRPAFYVPDQDPGATYVRPVAVIDPCRADGSTCSGSATCCSGMCSAGTCTQPDDSLDCATTDALCTVDADCCNRAERCIASFCTALAP